MRTVQALPLPRSSALIDLQIRHRFSVLLVDIVSVRTDICEATTYTGEMTVFLTKEKVKVIRQAHQIWWYWATQINNTSVVWKNWLLRCDWAPHTRLYVYNLGPTAAKMKEIKSWPNLIDIVWWEGFPDYVPKHARVGKVYAWKPIAIDEAAKRFGKKLVFDAGTVIRGPLHPLETILEQTGYFLAQGQDGDMKKLTHPGTFKWFNFTKETFEAGSSFGGGTQVIYILLSTSLILLFPNYLSLSTICLLPA